MNSLEALERIKNAPTIYVGLASDVYTRYSFECKKIENSLKALGIIIKKNVNIYWLKLCVLEKNGLEMYNARNNQELTNDEYELLKEIYEQFKAI